MIDLEMDSRGIQSPLEGPVKGKVASYVLMDAEPTGRSHQGQGRVPEAAERKPQTSTLIRTPEKLTCAS